MTRREFFKLSGLTSLFLVTSIKGIKLNNSIFSLLDDDEKICNDKFKFFLDKGYKDKDLGSAIVEIGKSFLDTAYQSNTLEINPQNEQLVVDFTGFDCVTFVENCLAFARCLKLDKTTFTGFKDQLTKLRYRDGLIDGYSSRLHYFCDWIYDNQLKGVVTNITKELGGIEYDKTVNFMSRHPNSYKQLEDKSNLQSIKSVEKAINSRKKYYIPRSDIPDIYNSLQNGDIIATTASIEGLDVTHTGYVYKVDDGGTYFLHASSVYKKVIISSIQLADYLAEDPKKTGIMVARPVDV
jgi:hypothetical protein